MPRLEYERPALEQNTSDFPQKTTLQNDNSISEDLKRFYMEYDVDFFQVTLPLKPSPLKHFSELWKLSRNHQNVHFFKDDELRILMPTLYVATIESASLCLFFESPTERQTFKHRFKLYYESINDTIIRITPCKSQWLTASTSFVCSQVLQEVIEKTNMVSWVILAGFGGKLKVNHAWPLFRSLLCVNPTKQMQAFDLARLYHHPGCW
eukprot:Awhi_evm1s8265